MKKLCIIVIVVTTTILTSIWLHNRTPVNQQPVPVPVETQPTNSINESAVVEAYIRNNIATLAPEAPVLGGRWYVVSIATDTTTKTSHITYEDGHIQGKAVLTYSLTNTGVVTITKTEKES